MYIVESLYHPTPHVSQWITDGIGDNEPRSMAECEADIRAFRAGECGPDMITGTYRVVEVAQ